MRISEVQRRSRALVHEMGIEELPVDILDVATRLGITVVTKPLEEDISAVLVLNGHRAAIGVNENHHLHRQRFSIAHELAHYMLHRDAANVFVDSTLTFYRDGRSAEGVYEQEIEANAFAAELLMPAELVRYEVKRSEVDIHDDVAIARLAARFKVSQQALMIRLVRMGLINE